MKRRRKHRIDAAAWMKSLRTSIKQAEKEARTSRLWAKSSEISDELYDLLRLADKRRSRKNAAEIAYDLSHLWRVVEEMRRDRRRTVRGKIHRQRAYDAVMYERLPEIKWHIEQLRRKLGRV